jgi:hypothetical protein
MVSIGRSLQRDAIKKIKIPGLPGCPGKNLEILGVFDFWKL